jgi:hypothetical protein
MKPWILAVLLIFTGSFAWSDVSKSTVEPKQTNAVAKLVQEGKRLYVSGKNKEAKALLRQALKVEPSNKAAYYYLDLLKEAEYRERASARHSDDGEMLLTDPPKSPRTGEWIYPQFVQPKEPRLPVPDLKLPSEPLQSKTFQLDMKIVTEKLHLVPDGGTVVQKVGDTTYVTRGNHYEERSNQVREWAQSLGDHLYGGGKFIILSESTGRLVVRGTEKEVAIIEAAIQPMLLKKPAETKP